MTAPARKLSPAELLALLPRTRPARFIDEIAEVDEEHILAKYTWREEDCQGHFPGNPVVPGVKLIEMGVQAGNVAWGIYHSVLGGILPAEPGRVADVFTGIERGRFKKMVRPGDKAAVRAVFGPDGYFRAGEIVCRVEIRLDGGPSNGEIIFTGRTSGRVLPRPEKPA